MRHVQATMIALLTSILLVGCGGESPGPAEGPVSEKPPTEDVDARLQRAKLDRTWLDMSELAIAVAMYELDHHGRIPAALDELTQLDAELVNPYMYRIPKDGWGNAFDYRPDGRQFTIASAGPDRVLGTADDLVYPKPGK